MFRPARPAFATAAAALAASALVSLAASAAPAAPDPQAVFERPPQSAKTGVWWHWMGCNVTSDGIVRDLDWFARVGVGSATIFGIADVCTPWAKSIPNSPTAGLVAFTPEWWRLVRFACEEAEKRGIELGLHNCPGYTSTGGPWIPPRLAMRELVFNVTNAAEQVSLAAHADFPVYNGETGKLEMPSVPARRDDLQEIAVVGGVRVAHVPMGAFTQPNQWEAFGLECDKMSAEAVSFHLDHVIGEMKRHLGEQVGRGLKFVLLDSYEAGTPTWTPKMREEFKARRGYDPLPFLPVLGGFHVASAEREAAFRADWDRTVKDLYRDVLFRTMREKLAAAGLEFACEPYAGPFDSRECAAHVDRLMTEFWFSPSLSRDVPKRLGWNRWTGPGGRRHNVVEAEAFTGPPESCAWSETPLQLKACGDQQFAAGVNRFILHSSPLQPWGEGVVPGISMGRWGTHFGRTQTWAESGKGWFAYLNRCQALLQWGEPAASDPAVRDVRPAGAPVSALARTADGKWATFVVNHSDAPVTLSLGLPDASLAAEWFDPVSGRVAPLAAKGGAAEVSLPACGSGFVVQRRRPDAAADASAEPAFAPRDPVMTAFGPWRLAFPGRGGKASVETTLDSLRDWTELGDARMRHFSGTATYRASFEVVGGEGAAMPDAVSLGDCNGQVARVLVNGIDCGTAWCPPYEVRIPAGAVRAGANELAVEFTNVWANRLIGDEREPADCEFEKATLPGGSFLVRFPDWFVRGESRPSPGRECFVTWSYFGADSPLVPSGLLGPVRLMRPAEVAGKGR